MLRNQIANTSETGKLNGDLHQPFGIRCESRSFSVRYLVCLAYRIGLISRVKLSIVVPQAIGISLCNTDLEEQLKAGLEQDEIYQTLQAKMKENPTKSLSKGYSLNEKGFLLYKDRMYVPNIPKVKLLILDEIHKTPYSSHPGYQKTITMLRKEYFGKT